MLALKTQKKWLLCKIMSNVCMIVGWLDKKMYFMKGFCRIYQWESVISKPTECIYSFEWKNIQAMSKGVFHNLYLNWQYQGIYIQIWVEKHTSYIKNGNLNVAHPNNSNCALNS